MMIEVLFYDRIGGYKSGQVAEIEDGVFLRAILKSGKADVVNPPDWSPESHDAKIKEDFKVDSITKPKRQKNVVVAETN
jgi:hypothetical protein